MRASAHSLRAPRKRGRTHPPCAAAATTRQVRRARGLSRAERGRGRDRRRHGRMGMPLAGLWPAMALSHPGGQAASPAVALQTGSSRDIAGPGAPSAGGTAASHPAGTLDAAEPAAAQPSRLERWAAGRRRRPPRPRREPPQARRARRLPLPRPCPPQEDPRGGRTGRTRRRRPPDHRHQLRRRRPRRRRQPPSPLRLRPRPRHPSTDPQRCPSQRPRLPRRPHWRSSPQVHAPTLPAAGTVPTSPTHIPPPSPHLPPPPTHTSPHIHGAAPPRLSHPTAPPDPRQPYPTAPLPPRPHPRPPPRT